MRFTTVVSGQYYLKHTRFLTQHHHNYRPVHLSLAYSAWADRVVGNFCYKKLEFLPIPVLPQPRLMLVSVHPNHGYWELNTGNEKGRENTLLVRSRSSFFSVFEIDIPIESNINFSQSCKIEHVGIFVHAFFGECVTEKRTRLIRRVGNRTEDIDLMKKNELTPLSTHIFQSKAWS